MASDGLAPQLGGTLVQLLRCRVLAGDPKRLTDTLYHFAQRLFREPKEGKSPGR